MIGFLIQVFKMLFGLWVQKKGSRLASNMKAKTLKTYIQSVQVVRLFVFLIVGLMASFVITLGCILTLLLGLWKVLPLDDIEKAWVCVGLGGAGILLMAFALYTLLSESLWMKVFKVDVLVDNYIRKNS